MEGGDNGAGARDRQQNMVGKVNPECNVCSACRRLLRAYSNARMEFDIMLVGRGPALRPH